MLVFQILTHLESAIKRDHLLSNFETTKELLGSNLQSESDSSVSVLPWIPETTAAVALRLLELDVSIMCVKQEKVEPSENKEARAYIVSVSVPLIPLFASFIACAHVSRLEKRTYDEYILM